ncbi:endonuclease domain-containing protein [Lysobacter stagni]
MATDAEALLWRQLRAHRFAGFKFKRQQPLEPFIADFVCFASRVVIEVDGGQHGDAVAYDERRTRWLATQGFMVLRFWNDEVLLKTSLVLDAICFALHER